MISDLFVRWTEDECTRNTPGHEGVEDAFLRITGRPLVWNEAKEIDHGDCFEYQFHDVSVWNIHGAYHTIRRIP
jgi:hypothetical protein